MRPITRSLRACFFTLVALLVTGLFALATPARANDARYMLGTYLGGPQSDYGRAVAVDAQGNIYIAGDTYSSTFSDYDLTKYGSTDILVLKISPDGKDVLAGVLIGTTAYDEVIGMVVTPAGEPILTIMPDNEWGTHNALNPHPTNGNKGLLVKLNATLEEEVFSTYTLFDMSNQGGQNIALDAAGNIYVTGDRYVPTLRARDLIVQKYSPDGQQLLYERIWNGDRGGEYGQGIDVRPDGSAYVTGVVEGDDSDFAVTADAIQPKCAVEIARGPNAPCGSDAFIVMLNPDGSTRYASYLGGTASDSGVDLAIDGQGNVVIIGSTFSTDFPTTSGAILPTCKADGQNGCYYDTFVTKLSADGHTMVYSTYLNSDEPSVYEFTKQVVADANGNATVIGFTAGQRFPVKNPIQDALLATPCIATVTRFCYDTFVTTFGPSGELAFSTYLGGRFDDKVEDGVLGPDGSLYLIGITESSDFPVTAGARQSTASGGNDFFLARLNGTSKASETPVPTTPVPTTPVPTTPVPTTPVPGGPSQPFKVLLPYVKR